MDEIKGIARVKFHPGKVEEWKRLSEEAMEIVRTRDSGTLQYEIFFNEDESEAVVFERYRDAHAAIEHFSNISHLMEPIMATASVTGEVLGTPNAKMKELLGKGGPKLFKPWMALQDFRTNDVGLKVMAQLAFNGTCRDHAHLALAGDP